MIAILIGQIMFKCGSFRELKSRKPHPAVAREDEVGSSSLSVEAVTEERIGMLWYSTTKSMEQGVACISNASLFPK